MVNNAGIAQVNPISEVQPEEVAQILKINIAGVLWGIQAAAARFKARGHKGKIIPRLLPAMRASPCWASIRPRSSPFAG